MLVADKEVGLLLSGTGDVLEPEGRRHGDRLRRQLRAGGGARARRCRAWTPRRSCAGRCRSPAEICVYTNAQRRHRDAWTNTLHEPASTARQRLAKTCMTSFSPREIVSELDRYIVGQNDAKRAVAIALRNRWRRQQLEGPLREEVAPKNILMIGPTGCGKTEISRRLARLANAPFLKVEATKFTEVGYVGRDVEQIVRDLVEVGIGLVQGERGARRCRRRRISPPRSACSTRWSAPTASAGDPRSLPPEAARQRARRQGDRGRDRIGRPADCRCSRFPACPAPRSARSTLGDMFGKAFGRTRASRGASRCKEAYEPAARRGERQAARPGRDRPGGDPRRSRTTASSSSTRSTRSAGREGARRRRRLARRRAARPAAADRGHDGRDQARRR